MKLLNFALLSLCIFSSGIAQQLLPTRPVTTYSIVAKDETTGELGVAVQSHWFSVGFLVPWAKAGVGAVATQSFVKADYGPDGLKLMESGMTSTEALETFAPLLCEMEEANLILDEETFIEAANKLLNVTPILQY